MRGLRRPIDALAGGRGHKISGLAGRVAADDPPLPTGTHWGTLSTASIEWFRRVVPAFGSLRGYRAADARADLVAGLTVAAVAVPQAMAYALVAGLPAEYGLYTAIVMTAVGALFDSSRQLINGPTNAISIAVLSVIAGVEPGLKVQAAVTLALLVGLVQLAITLFRLGDLSRYISHSVIVGFTLGAGSLLVLDQVKNLFGMKAVGGVHDHFLVRFVRSLIEGGGVHVDTAAIGFGSIVLVLAIRWLKKRMSWRLLPDLLLVVIVMAGIVAAFDLEKRGVRVVGEIPARLPSFAVPVLDLGVIREFSTGALAIAVLGLLEAIAMAKAIAAQTKQKLDMNQQCLSEGLANLTGSFFHCFPGSGSLTRSAINQQAGASTQWSGVWSAVAVALIMLVFAPYARFIPRAALAGILMVSAYKMIDWAALSYHWRATRFDAAIVAATAISAVAISVEFCVLIGVFMSFMLTVPRAGRMLLTQFVVTDEGGIYERLPDDVPCDRILIFGLEGELFFGATGELENHLATIEERVSEQTEFVVLRMKRTRNPDAVGMTIIEASLDRLAKRGVRVLLCGVKPEFQQKLIRTGLINRLREQIFLEQPVRQTSTLLAIRHAYDNLSDPCLLCPRRDAAKRGQPLYFAI
ncbi:MAG: SulP family inorganic anion transporter [Gemmatimonadaceae bacterium]